jgi:tetratricopeptide (TPR) repeat protein
LMTGYKAGSASTAFLLQAEACFLVTGDCATADRLFDRALEDARLCGLPGHRLVARAERAYYVQAPTAKWDDAARFAREVLDLAPENFAIPRFYAHATLGPIAFARNSIAESREHFDRALSIISQASQVSFVLPGVVGFAKQLCAESAFKRALEILQPNLELLERSPANLLSTMPLLACQRVQTEALLGIGKIEDAEANLRRMRELGPAVLGQPWAVALLSQAEGLLQEAKDDYKGASGSHMAASMEFDRLNWKLDLADSEFRLGLSLQKLRKGDEKPAA